MSVLDQLAAFSYKSALQAFVDAVHASGGHVDDDFWDAYIEACDALGVDPMERPE